MDSVICIVDVLPELLGTYGDYGNVIVLAKRLQLRGFKVRIIQATADKSIPQTGDVYVLGGGEDSPQSEAAKILRNSKSLNIAYDNGSFVFGVCAGFQILGNSFVADNKVEEGIGLADFYSVRGSRRSVGELVINSDIFGPNYLLSGFENHGGVTVLGQDVEPLGRVLIGKGNGYNESGNSSYKTDNSTDPMQLSFNKYSRSIDDKFSSKMTKKTPIQFRDGILSKRLLCTYMHGPVLARNYKLADFILNQIVPIEDEVDALGRLNTYSERLRTERLKSTL